MEPSTHQISKKPKFENPTGHGFSIGLIKNVGPFIYKRLYCTVPYVSFYQVILVTVSPTVYLFRRFLSSLRLKMEVSATTVLPVFFLLFRAFFRLHVLSFFNNAFCSMLGKKMVFATTVVCKWHGMK